jgi:hypothetical protein
MEDAACCLLVVILPVSFLGVVGRSKQFILVFVRISTPSHLILVSFLFTIYQTDAFT